MYVNELIVDTICFLCIFWWANLNINNVIHPKVLWIEYSLSTVGKISPDRTIC
jgi:hypothetical protein